MTSWPTKRQLGIFLLISLTTLFAAACASGDQGTQGANGPQGNAGVAGASGDTGHQGASGPAGPAGPSGSTGSQGAKGPSGDPATSTAPSLIILPSAIETGGNRFTLRGAGFTPGETISVEIQEGGTTFTPPRISAAANQTVNANGAFESDWSSSSTSTPGFYTVYAMDGTGLRTSVTLTIVAPKT